MDEDNTFEELIDSIEPTSSGSMSQNALKPGTLIEITNHLPKRLRKDPFWNELTKVEKWNEIMVAIKANVEPYSADKILKWDYHRPAGFFSC